MLIAMYTRAIPLTIAHPCHSGGYMSIGPRKKKQNTR